MNLEITPLAEATYHNVAKVSKAVHNKESSPLPWFAIFEIKNEKIDVAKCFPEGKPDENGKWTQSQYIASDAAAWRAGVWDVLVDELRSTYAKNGCYVVVEMCREHEGNVVSTPVFFKWCPDTVPARPKMLLGSSFQSTKKKFDALGVTPELSQASELDLATFVNLAKLKNFTVDE